MDEINRREFFEIGLASVVGLALSGLPEKQMQTQKKQETKPIKSTATDVKKREFYLKGLIDGGKRMFDDERVLAYRHENGSESWGVFPDYLIKDGMLRVEIAGEDSAKGLVYVVLPQQLENNSNMLCVKREQICVA